MKVGIAKRALHNATHCGDQCGYWQIEGKTILCMVDGLGHGEHAELASLAALGFVAAHLSLPLPELFSGCDQGIRNSSGAAMSIAIVEEDSGSFQYAAVGNIRGVLFNDKVHRLRCVYGIIGAGYRKLSVEKHIMKAGDSLILYTDGIREVIQLDDYEKNLLNDPSKLAGRILKDWQHSRDDSAVLVYQKE